MLAPKTPNDVIQKDVGTSVISEGCTTRGASCGLVGVSAVELFMMGIKGKVWAPRGQISECFGDCPSALFSGTDDWESY